MSIFQTLIERKNKRSYTEKIAKAPIYVTKEELNQWHEYLEREGLEKINMCAGVVLKIFEAEDIFDIINHKIHSDRAIIAKEKPLQLTTTEYKLLLDAKIKAYNSPYKTGDTYKFKEIEVIND